MPPKMISMIQASDLKWIIAKRQRKHNCKYENNKQEWHLSKVVESFFKQCTNRLITIGKKLAKVGADMGRGKVRGQGRGYGRGRGRTPGRGNQTKSRSDRKRRKKRASSNRKAFLVDGKLDHRTLCWLAGLPPDKRKLAELNARRQAGLEESCDKTDTDSKDAKHSLHSNRENDCSASDAADNEKAPFKCQKKKTDASLAVDSNESKDKVDLTAEELAQKKQLCRVQFMSDSTRATVNCKVDQLVFRMTPIKRCFLNRGKDQENIPHKEDTLLGTHLKHENNVESIDLQSQTSLKPSSLRKLLRKFLGKVLRQDKKTVLLRPVQSKCLYHILSGRNVVVVAPTGSGKTLAYIAPMIPHILHNKKFY